MVLQCVGCSSSLCRRTSDSESIKSRDRTTHDNNGNGDIRASIPSIRASTPSISGSSSDFSCSCGGFSCSSRRFSGSSGGNSVLSGSGDDLSLLANSSWTCSRTTGGRRASREAPWELEQFSRHLGHQRQRRGGCRGSRGRQPSHGRCCCSGFLGCSRRMRRCRRLAPRSCCCSACLGGCYWIAANCIRRHICCPPCSCWRHPGRCRGLLLRPSLFLLRLLARSRPQLARPSTDLDRDGLRKPGRLHLSSGSALRSCCRG